MRKLFTTFGLFLITTLSFAQETKYVVTELLNVRSGAGTKYDVIDKISQGEKVIAYSTQGKWTEIELTNGKRGYVSANFLSDERINKESSKSENKGNWVYFLLIGGVPLISLFSKGGGSKSSSSQSQHPKL